MTDWTFPADAGTEGIYEIGRRLAEQLGRIPDATTFLHDPREMLTVTRRVEAAATGGRLLVGFQTAAKLDVEGARYRTMLEAGTTVTAFATGRPEARLDGLDYRELRPDTLALANQWFLVSDDPEPIAFVSWELGDPRRFGVGGAATPGKTFVGFVSDDAEVVADLVAVLEGVPGIRTAVTRGDTNGASAGDDPRVAEVIARAEATATDPTGAAPGAVLIPIGRGDEDAIVPFAIALARAEGRRAVFIDRSAEGILSSPYSMLRADDDLRPRPDRLFDAAVARREGRTRTAIAIDAATTFGVDAGAWFPTASGADGLRAAVEQFDGAVIVVGDAARSPSIGERIRGMTLERLDRLGPHVVIAP